MRQRRSGADADRRDRRVERETQAPQAGRVALRHAAQRVRRPSPDLRNRSGYTEDVESHRAVDRAYAGDAAIARGGVLADVADERDLVRQEGAEHLVIPILPCE